MRASWLSLRRRQPPLARLDAAERRLGQVHAAGQLALRQAGRFAQPGDAPAELALV